MDQKLTVKLAVKGSFYVSANSAFYEALKTLKTTLPS